MIKLQALAMISLAFCAVSATTFDINSDAMSKDPLSMLNSLHQGGLTLGSSGSIFSKLLENDPSPAEFVSQASSSMFGSLAGASIDLSGRHWKPDWKTKRNFLKLMLRVVIRKFKNGLDIRKFLDNSKAQNYISKDGPFGKVGDHCPWLDLWKKQLQRIADNISDEIAFIEEILKNKDCAYLRLKLKILYRDLDSVNAIIKYIDEHNQVSDDHKDLICLFKHLIDNCLANLGDVEEFIRAILRANIDPFPHNKTSVSNVSRRECPFLRLKQRLHWREAVNAADAYGFTYWLNHRHERSRRDCWRLKMAIKKAIWRIAKAYGARRRHRRRDDDRRRHHRRDDDRDRRDRRHRRRYMRVETA